MASTSIIDCYLCIICYCTNKVTLLYVIKCSTYLIRSLSLFGPLNFQQIQIHGMIAITSRTTSSPTRVPMMTTLSCASVFACDCSVVAMLFVLTWLVEDVGSIAVSPVMHALRL